MINPQTGQRELVYVTKIDKVEPIPGRDRVESAVVGGWTVMVRKDQFHAGDLGIYFEIDSKVPAKEPFEFLKSKNYKIKTQKYAIKDENGNKIGQYWSQGLLMSFDDFDWEKDKYAEGTFLTKELEVIYADTEDNKRKGKSPDKYAKMTQRHPNLFKKPFVRKIMKYECGRRVMFLLFGKKKDGKGWPEWVVKTDEERIQNLVHMIPEYSKETWIATEKIDGTSTTFTLKGRGRKADYRVCSRNVNMTQRNDGSWYETNVYTEMAEKYDMRKVLEDMMNLNSNIDFVTIQAETYGAGIQRRDYTMIYHDMAVFNVIFGYKDGSTERLNPAEGKSLMDTYNIPYVPVLGEVTLPDTCEGILALAGGNSRIDGGMREGLVFRSLDGMKSFKAVDNEFLAKYHG